MMTAAHASSRPFYSPDYHFPLSPKDGGSHSADPMEPVTLTVSVQEKCTGLAWKPNEPCTEDKSCLNCRGAGVNAKRYFIDVTYNSTIEAIKQKISDIKGCSIKPTRQKLTSGKHELKEGALWNYNIISRRSDTHCDWGNEYHRGHSNKPDTTASGTISVEEVPAARPVPPTAPSLSHGTEYRRGAKLRIANEYFVNRGKQRGGPNGTYTYYSDCSKKYAWVRYKNIKFKVKWKHLSLAVRRRLGSAPMRRLLAEIQRAQ